MIIHGLHCVHAPSEFCICQHLPVFPATIYCRKVEIWWSNADVYVRRIAWEQKLTATIPVISVHTLTNSSAFHVIVTVTW